MCGLDVYTVRAMICDTKRVRLDTKPDTFGSGTAMWARRGPPRSIRDLLHMDCLCLGLNNGLKY